MSYILPNFNLQVGIWRGPNTLPVIPVGPAAVMSVGNLAYGRRVSFAGIVKDLTGWLLLPAFTDLRVDDMVEIPFGSGRYYVSRDVDDFGKGFTNEHRFGQVEPVQVCWPTPYP